MLYYRVYDTHPTDDDFCIPLDVENAKSTGFDAPLASDSENVGAIEITYLPLLLFVCIIPEH